MRRLTPLIIIGILLTIVTACNQAASTPTPAGPATTAGQLAALGQVVFEANCRECHVNADGPNVDLWLQAYSKAGQMYDDARRTMPPSNPGGLKAEDYLQVVAWALVEYKVVPPAEVLDLSQLANIALK